MKLLIINDYKSGNSLTFHIYNFASSDTSLSVITANGPPKLYGLVKRFILKSTPNPDTPSTLGGDF